MTHSKPIRCFVLEDEPSANRFLQKVLTSHFEDVAVVGSAETVANAVPVLQNEAVDLVFLDIELPNQNGFALFQYFQNPTFKVIFTTAYEQYAIKAFRYAALDYLLKPIDLEELSVSIKRFHAMPPIQDEQLTMVERGMDQHFGKLALPYKEGYHFVNIADILRCEADGNYTRFFFLDGSKMLVSKTLKEYETLMIQDGFFRANRSDLINMRSVTSYLRSKKAQVTLSDGSVISLSPNRKEAFLASLT